jgi:hypothetical protein
MVPLFVFYVHVVAFAWMFTKRWQEEGMKEGLLAVFFMGLIFFVGWSITSFVMKLVMEQEGFGTLLNRDAASLVLLTCAEAVLYWFYLRDERSKNGTTEA